MTTGTERALIPGALRPRVVSMRRGAAGYDRLNAVRIDRRNPRWGNPYRTETRAPADRERVIRLYGELLHHRISTGVVSRRELADLCGKNLECWCAPLTCHGDRIADAAVAAAGTDRTWNDWLKAQAELYKAA